MIEALVIFALLALHVWITREHDADLLALSARTGEEGAATAAALNAALATERARVSELLRLLEARSAPAEFAAYAHHDVSQAILPNDTWIFSDDGLIGHKVDDDD